MWHWTCRTSQGQIITTFCKELEKNYGDNLSFQLKIDSKKDWETRLTEA